MEKVEIKNLTPLISVISAGKTSLLKVIYNIDILQVSSGIGTKFVNIIRYNPKIGKQLRFYHLILIKRQNGDYDFFKDITSEIIGNENIKKKNIELNEYLKKNNVPYKDLFYMVEVGEGIVIKDEEYLKNYDLVDIPGLSEYCPSKKEDNTIINLDAPLSAGNEKKKVYYSIQNKLENYNPKNDINYLTQIFGIIKNKINNGIILLSIENFQLEENYIIIGKLFHVINKPIENFLVLLNKIDKSENIENDIKILNSKIMNYFSNGNIFNMTKNTIVPCCTFQFECQIKMNKSFKYLMYNLFLNFLISVKKGNKLNFSFMDFLKNLFYEILGSKTILKSELREKILDFLENGEIVRNLGEIKETIKYLENAHISEQLKLWTIDEDDFKKEAVSKTIENLIGEDEEEEDDDDENKDKNISKAKKSEINIENIEENLLIIYYFIEFNKKNKKFIPLMSQDYSTIIHYFTTENMKKKEDKDEIKILKLIKTKKLEMESMGYKIDNLFKNLEIFYEKYKKENKENKENNNEILYRYITKTQTNLKKLKYIYIPLIGLSNSGKSTILNSLIGMKLLPCHMNECTKKGIIIKYWDLDIPVLFKTNLKEENKTYYF